jgi:hypothetical protein
VLRAIAPSVTLETVVKRWNEIALALAEPRRDRIPHL